MVATAQCLHSHEDKKSRFYCHNTLICNAPQHTMYPSRPKNWQKLRLRKSAIYSDVTFQNTWIANTSCRCLVSGSQHMWVKDKFHKKPGQYQTRGHVRTPPQQNQTHGVQYHQAGWGHNARASLPAWLSRPLVTGPVKLQELTIYSSHFCIDGRSTWPQQLAG